MEQAVKSKKIWEDHFKGVNPNDYKDPVLRRKLKKLVILGAEILEPKKLEEVRRQLIKKLKLTKNFFSWLMQ